MSVDTQRAQGRHRQRRLVTLTVVDPPTVAFSVVAFSEPPSGPVRTLPQRIRGPLLGLAGQFLNAGTNVATAYVASFLLAPDAFGSFVLAFACVTMVLAAGRGLLGSTIVVHLPAQEPEAREALVRSALGFTVLLGLVASVVLGAFGGVLLWFAPWITIALVQDVGRYVFLADGRTGAAFLLDLAWAIVQAGVVAVWLTVGSIGIDLLATAWGAGALAGVVLFAVMSRARLGHPAFWVRATRDVAGWFTAVALIGAVELYMVLLVTGALLGPAETGGLRAVQLLAFQPAMVVAGALTVLLTPAAVHARDSRAALARSAKRLLLSVTPLLALLALIAVLHRPLMGLLFGQYTAYAPLVVPIAVQAMLVVIMLPATVVLRALRRGRSVFVAQSLRLLLMAAAAVAGAVLGGAPGLAWAIAAAALLSLLQVSASAYLTTRRAVLAA